MAWRQPGKLRPPPHPQTRIDATPDTHLVPRRRGAGAVERADDHTKHPIAVGNLAAAKVRNRSISTHGPDPPRALATAAWLGRHRLVAGRRRWPRLDASPRQRAPGPARAAAGPSATAAATVTQSGPGKRGQSRGWPRAPTRPCCPTCHRSAPGPAVETSAITRTDLTDLTRLSPQASMWRVPVAGRRLGWAVRRLVLGSARAGDRAAGSLAVAEMRVRRASWPACGRRRWAGWWRR